MMGMPPSILPFVGMGYPAAERRRDIVAIAAEADTANVRRFPLVNFDSPIDVTVNTLDALAKVCVNNNRDFSDQIERYEQELMASLETMTLFSSAEAQRLMRTVADRMDGSSQLDRLSANARLEGSLYPQKLFDFVDELQGLKYYKASVRVWKTILALLDKAEDMPTNAFLQPDTPVSYPSPSLRFGTLTKDQDAQYEALMADYNPNWKKTEAELKVHLVKLSFDKLVGKLFEYAEKLATIKPVFLVPGEMARLESALMLKLKHAPVIDPIVQVTLNAAKSETDLDVRDRIEDFEAHAVSVPMILSLMQRMRLDTYYTPSDAVWTALNEAMAVAEQPGIKLTIDTEDSE